MIGWPSTNSRTGALEPGVSPQLRAVEGVLHEADVEDEVGLERHAELEAEADDLERELLRAGLRAERRDDPLSQLPEGRVRRVDRRLRHRADLVEQRALAGDRRLHAVVLGVQRVAVARLRVAPDERLVARLEEDDLGLDVAAVEGAQRGPKRHRRVALAHVEDDGDAVDSAPGRSRRARPGRAAARSGRCPRPCSRGPRRSCWRPSSRRPRVP